MQPVCNMVIQQSQLLRGGGEKYRAFVGQHVVRCNQGGKYLSLWQL